MHLKLVCCTGNVVLALAVSSRCGSSLCLHHARSCLQRFEFRYVDGPLHSHALFRHAERGADVAGTTVFPLFEEAA